MAKVNVSNVLVMNNPAPFKTKLEFEVTFECLEPLTSDLEWKMTYVGHPEEDEYDQILETVDIGPVPEGVHKFVFSADPPNLEKLPESEVVGVTVVLLTCSYKSKEFVHYGYFVNNEYVDPELTENPPEKPDFDKLQRDILATNPRVTNIKINWDDSTINDDEATATEEALEVANDNQSQVTEQSIAEPHTEPEKHFSKKDTSSIHNNIPIEDQDKVVTDQIAEDNSKLLLSDAKIETSASVETSSVDDKDDQTPSSVDNKDDQTPSSVNDKDDQTPSSVDDKDDQTPSSNSNVKETELQTSITTMEGTNNNDNTSEPVKRGLSMSPESEHKSKVARTCSRKKENEKCTGSGDTLSTPNDETIDQPSLEIV